jgi:hypothetical protein
MIIRSLMDFAKTFTKSKVDRFVIGLVKSDVLLVFTQQFVSSIAKCANGS